MEHDCDAPQEHRDDPSCPCTFVVQQDVADAVEESAEIAESRVSGEAAGARERAWLLSQRLICPIFWLVSMGGKPHAACVGTFKHALDCLCNHCKAQESAASLAPEPMTRQCGTAAAVALGGEAAEGGADAAEKNASSEPEGPSSKPSAELKSLSSALDRPQLERRHRIVAAAPRRQSNRAMPGAHSRAELQIRCAFVSRSALAFALHHWLQLVMSFVELMLTALALSIAGHCAFVTLNRAPPSQSS